MARRRTRREKLNAVIRRNTEQSRPEPEFQKKIDNGSFYVPEISLSTKLVALDLTKTVAVTILALILQFALAGYLNAGGWQTINGVIHGILAIY
jgi:hypothetical protein